MVLILVTLILSIDSLAYGEIISFTSDKNQYSIDEQMIFSGLSEANERSISIIIINPLGELETFVSEISKNGNFEIIFNSADIFSVDGIHKITAHVTDEPRYEGIALLFDFDGSFINNLTKEIKSKDSWQPIQELPPNCKIIKTEEISAVFCDDDVDEMISESQQVPEWIKQTSIWWSQGNSSDREFLEGLLFLSQHNKINIHDSLQSSQPLNDKVPKWLKKTVAWWGENKISEREFLNAAEYLLDKKIIQIKN